MAVYIDEPKDYGKLYLRGQRTLWCHLTADSLDELQGFAAKLGLARRWFQGPTSEHPHRVPHYDVTSGKRWQALKLGAVAEEAGSEEAIARHRGWRLALKADPNATARLEAPAAAVAAE